MLLGNISRWPSRGQGAFLDHELMHHVGIVDDDRVLRAQLEANDGTPFLRPLLECQKRQALRDLMEVADDRETNWSWRKICWLGCGNIDAVGNEENKCNDGDGSDAKMGGHD